MKESFKRKLVRSRLKWAENGRGMVNEDNGCAQSGGKNKKMKTANKMGGLCEERFRGIGRGGDWERQMGEWRQVHTC